MCRRGERSGRAVYDMYDPLTRRRDMRKACNRCGARPAIPGRHHRHGKVACSRYRSDVDVLGAISRPWSPTPAHDACDLLGGADTPDEVRQRVAALQAAEIMLAEVAGSA